MKGTIRVRSLILGRSSLSESNMFLLSSLVPRIFEKISQNDGFLFSMVPNYISFLILQVHDQVSLSLSLHSLMEELGIGVTFTNLDYS